MKKLTMKNQCRHGDIFIERIASLPENLKSAGERSIILAEGTATGHKHVYLPTNNSDTYKCACGKEAE